VLDEVEEDPFFLLKHVPIGARERVVNDKESEIEFEETKEQGHPNKREKGV